jgi:hypothetical protein
MCILPVIMVVACSQEKKTQLIFSNDVEGKYWSSSSSVIEFPQAHSGNHVNKLNKQNAFSNTFNIRIKDISSKPVKRVRISAWFMLTGDNSERNLVLDIRDSSNQKSLEWINADARDYIPDLNQWAKAELVVDLTLKNRNNPENTLGVYAANGKEEPIYVDDIEILFEN